MMKLYFSFFFLILFSCTKPESPDPYPEIEDPIAVDSVALWRTDLCECIVGRPMPYNDMIIWPTFQKDETLGEVQIFISTDKETGEILWKSPKIPGWSAIRDAYGIANDHILVNAKILVYSLSALTGELVWAYEPPGRSQYMPRLNIIGDHGYIVEFDPAVEPRTNHVVRTRADRMTWDTVFTYARQDPFRHGIEMPVLWMNESGDSILVMQDRTGDIGPGTPSIIDVLAYNMKKDTFEWVITDISPTGNSSVTKMPVVNDQILVILDWYLALVDLVTGKEIWKKEYGDAANHFFTNEIVVEDGVIYFMQDYDQALFAVDWHTGDILWRDDDVGRSCDGLALHDGFLIKNAYQTFDQIVALDVNSRKVVWTYDDVTTDSYLSSNTFYIDKETSRLYISNWRKAICIPLFK